MVKKLAPLALAIGLLAGCALSPHPKIADLKYNPGRYQNHSVTVDGIVTSSWGIPLMPFRLYKVDDLKTLSEVYLKELKTAKLAIN